jgi:hypothetical protein
VWSLLPPPSAASPRAVAVFCQHVIQRSNIECLVRHDRLQPPILFLELAQPVYLMIVNALPWMEVVLNSFSRIGAAGTVSQT